MEIQSCWIIGQTNQLYIKVSYRPGVDNISGYLNKAHATHLNEHVRPYYQHVANSSKDLTRVASQAHNKGALKH